MFRGLSRDLTKVGNWVRDCAIDKLHNSDI